MVRAGKIVLEIFFQTIFYSLGWWHLFDCNFFAQKRNNFFLYFQYCTMYSRAFIDCVTAYGIRSDKGFIYYSDVGVFDAI